MEPEPCVSHDDHRQARCLNYVDSLQVNIDRTDQFVLRTNNLESLYDTVRRVHGNDRLGEWFVFQTHGICPRPFISEFAFTAWQLYCALDGTKRVATPAEYAGLPALYVSVCEVLDDEVAAASKIKQRLEESKQRRRQ